MPSISGINGILYLAHFSERLLQLNSITLTQFKNYLQQGFRFNERIVGISGVNGVGKTNLLDAIYYLCFTKSYFNRSDSANILTGASGFRVEGHFTKNGRPYSCICILRETGKKEFLLDDEPYDRFAGHVGKFPCVFIAPDDTRIITEGSEERRRYMDALISQIDADYLQRLISYNKILQQRNSYLKSIAERRMAVDNSLLDIYDSQLAGDGTIIYEKRSASMRQVTVLAKDFYNRISGSNESVELAYKSQLHKREYAAQLKDTRERDTYVQRTTVGVHKDDMQIFLEQQPFRNMASQGQRKSMLFALKLAEFTLLKDAKGFAPLLLLDDVFEKLDAGRMHNLLDWVCVQNEGQIFITDTHKQRICHHLENLGVQFELIDLSALK